MVLLHGYAQTGHMWVPAMTELVKNHTVIVPDLRGIGDWRNAFPAKSVWHFHFYGETPLKLVEGRERIYFEHFWNDFSADKNKSVKEADRKLYTAAYAQPGGMRAGFSYFSDFEHDAADFSKLSQTKLTMPVLTLAGEYSAGAFLGNQIRLVATDVQSQIIKGSGHWLIDEAPEQVVPALVQFLN